MSGYPWFRLYHEARIDAKLRTLSCEQFRVWFNLLCYAAENHNARGTIPALDTDLLAVEVANGDTDLLCATIERLKRLRILAASPDEDGALLFIHFEQRQWDKPSARPERNAARQRDFRERHKDEKKSEKRNASNTPVTRRNARVTRSNAQSNASNDTEEKRRDTDEKRLDESNDTSSNILSTSVQQHAAQTDREPLKLVRTAPHNPIWDALCAVFEYEPATKAERSNLGKIVKDLKEAGATADEIRKRASNHAEGVRNGSISWTLTPNALANHWGELAHAPRPLRDRAARNASNTISPDAADDDLTQRAQRDMAKYAAAVGED